MELIILDHNILVVGPTVDLQDQQELVHLLFLTMHQILYIITVLIIVVWVVVVLLKLKQ